MRKGLMGIAAITMMALAGVAHAEDKKVTIGVSIPAADHGWTRAWSSMPNASPSS